MFSTDAFAFAFAFALDAVEVKTSAAKSAAPAPTVRKHTEAEYAVALAYCDAAGVSSEPRMALIRSIIREIVADCADLD